MSSKKLINVVAAAAAVAFVTAPITSTLAQAKSHHAVKCYGINACKGKSACKTASSSCKGTNSCKGQGYMMKSAKQCKKMHGKIEEDSSN